MTTYKITLSDFVYEVNIFKNDDHDGFKKTPGFRKGEKTITIYTPNQSSSLKGYMYWSGRGLFNNPKNDYEEIFNYCKGHLI